MVDNNVHYAQAMRCKTRLIKAGVNLAAYNSRENAADVEDLRKALGYGKIDLYGASCGTRLALTAMRDRPQGIRSVILDGTYPPQASDLQAPANAERAFLELFKESYLFRSQKSGLGSRLLVAFAPPYRDRF